MPSRLAPRIRNLRSTTHPMRRAAVGALLDRTGASWAVVEELIRGEKLAEVAYRGEVFYIRSRATH